MKPTDFAYYLTGFLTKYLPGELGASINTIGSYRDSFTLFLVYMRDKHGFTIEYVKLADVKKEHVEGYLEWIEKERGCSVSTRNVRLAAIHSYFRYLQLENPDNILEWQRILSIPVKKCEKGTMSYASLDGLKLLLQQPDQTTSSGRRDLALLSFMYDTAARVQEAIDLTPTMIHIKPPFTARLIGKGGKHRIVPLMEPQIQLLARYMAEKNFLKPHSNHEPLFFNNRHEKLTRAGVAYILDKYVKMARSKDPSLIPDKFSCHCLRHSKSMHLLQGGVNLVYIRDLLGHSSIQTTEIYARADSKQKREAIEAAYIDVNPNLESQWQGNRSLMEWLKDIGRQHPST
jgi:site-specific recombinase XerD